MGRFSRLDLSLAFKTMLAANYSGAGTLHDVITPIGVIYKFFIDNANDPSYIKSTDNGVTWSEPIALKSCTGTQIAVWYDRWSGINAGLIHIAYTDSATDDTFYRTIDTENADTLGTEYTIFAGVSTAVGGSLSITRARGGNLMCMTCIDAGAEYDTRKSTDVGVNWTSPAEAMEGATEDQWILLPDFNADNQDVLCVFWDASADEVSIKRYDDSANSWAETSLATGMVDTAAATSYPHFAACTDLVNSKNYVIAWSAVDTASASLRCWEITSSSVTEKTTVVSSSTDDQALAALSIDQGGNLWAFYCGSTDGAETVNTILNIYYKKSTNGGTTWGEETKVTNLPKTRWLICTAPLFYNQFHITSHAGTSGGMDANIPNQLQRATFQLGL